MIRFAIRFPSGRFHATPWGHHVNEGVPEWPPSPWRIVRALAAAMYTRCPELDRPIALAALRLLAVPPSFTLPPATASHTRHYLSQNKLDRAGRLVFDAFVAVDRSEAILAHIAVSPSPAERRALAAMAAEVSYLGRAEAFCDLRLLDEDEPAPPPNCAPSDGVSVEGTITVRVLCPAEGFTEEQLTRTTSSLSREGYGDPPGTRWVFYRRRADALSAGPPRSVALATEGRPRVAELSLGGTVLPRFTEAVRVAEQIRAAAMSCNGSPPSPVLSGKDATGAARLDQHRHAHYVPEARGHTDRVTHVLVVAHEGFGEREQAALAAIHFLTQGRGRPDLDVVLSGFGQFEDFEAVSRLFGVSRRWRSRTPFVLPRHMKGNRHTPEEQIVRELSLRGFPAPERIERQEGVALFNQDAGPSAMTRWLAFRTRRRRDQNNAVVTTTGYTGFAITFAEAQRGPILLGYGAHYGLGQFGADDQGG